MSYVRIGKRFKFLADLTQNTDSDGDTLKLIIRHYIENIEKKLVNECRQFKEYIRSVSTHESLKYPEILQLIYERNLIEVFPRFDRNPKNFNEITNNEL
jgi:hypothetical protein